MIKPLLLAALLCAPSLRAVPPVISGSSSITINSSVGDIISTGTGAWISGIQHPSIAAWNISTSPSIPFQMQLLENGPFGGGQWGLYLLGFPDSSFTGTVVVTITQAGASGSAQLTINFNIVGPPTLSSQSFSAGTTGRPYSGSITASGGTGAISYAVTAGALPTGLSLSSGGAISGTASSAGSYNFTVTATDSYSQTASQAYSILINSAPSVSSISTVNVTLGQSVSVSPQLSGGTSPFSWGASGVAAGVNLNSSNGGLSGIPSSAGTYSVTLTATDSNGATASRSFSIVVAPALSLSSNSPPAGAVGGSYSHSLAASGGRSPYSFSVSGGSPPAGLSLSSAGVLSGTPTTATTTSFQATVSDANGASAVASVSVTIQLAVTLSSSGISPTTVGVSPTASVGASGGLGGPYTFSLQSGSLPSGLSLGSGGSISGTATMAGSYSFAVSATGSGSISGTQSFNWLVNPAINLTISPLTTSSVSGTLSRTISSTGGTGSIAYSLQSGSLPPGISLSGAALSGTYSSAGSFSFTIRATDSVGATTDLPLSVVVNPPVSIQTSALPGGWVTKSVSGNLATSGGTSPVTFQVVGGAMPSGVSLGSGGSFGGSFASAGSFTVSIRATDAVGSMDTRSYTIDVRPRMQIGPSGNLPAATVGAPYSVSIGATTSGSIDGITVGIGGLPPGLRFENGLLSGRPASTGVYSFSFGVTTTDGETATTDMTLLVNPALQFTLPPAQTLFVGSPMTWTPTLTGGTAPILVSLLGSSLPAGLTLNRSTGVISGTPTSAGTVAFTIEATDANVSRVQHFVTLPVVVPVLITTTLEPVYAVGKVWSIPLSAQNGSAPYTFKISAGSLPAGISIADNQLTGSLSQAGNYSFNLQVTDANGASTERSYKVLVSSGFTRSESWVKISMQRGQELPRQTVKLDSNPAGLPVTVSSSAPWLKFTPGSSATPGAIDYWTSSVNLEPGTYEAELTFDSPGLPSQKLLATMRVFVLENTTLSAEVVAAPQGQHTVMLRAQMMEVPFQAELEGPGAVSYRLSSTSGLASSAGATGLLISPSSNTTSLGLETNLIIRNGLSDQVLKLVLPTGGIAPIVVSAREINLLAPTDQKEAMETEVIVRTQSGARRYATTVDAAWLKVTPATGDLASMAKLGLTIDPGGLAAGENAGLVTIYLEDGREAATVRVVVNSAPVEPSPSVDKSAFVFSASKAKASLRLMNPTGRMVPFAVRSSSPAISTSIEAGTLAAGESRTLELAVKEFAGMQSVFVSFGDGDPAVVDAFWLSLQPNCESSPTIAWLSPARAASLKAGVSANVQALMTNGCGAALTQGSLSLLSAEGPALPLVSNGDGVWSTQWKANQSKTLELLYVSPDGLRQSRQFLSVDVK